MPGVSTDTLDMSVPSLGLFVCMFLRSKTCIQLGGVSIESMLVCMRACMHSCMQLEQVAAFVLFAESGEIFCCGSSLLGPL